MATPAEWLEGARLRTLPAAIAPVIAGSGVAVLGGSTGTGNAPAPPGRLGVMITPSDVKLIRTYRAWPG